MRKINRQHLHSELRQIDLYNDNDIKFFEIVI